jgi:hypothetical protein
MGCLAETDTHRLNKNYPPSLLRADPAQRSTVTRNYYDPYRRIRESRWPSFRLVCFREDRSNKTRSLRGAKRQTE